MPFFSCQAVLRARGCGFRVPDAAFDRFCGEDFGAVGRFTGLADEAVSDRSEERLRFNASIRLMTFSRDGAEGVALRGNWADFSLRIEASAVR